MDEKKGYEAFLHIVHVSDMHCRIAGSQADLRTERLVQWVAERVRPFSEEKARFIEEYWAEGLAGHEPRAHRHFCDFLSSFASDPQFSGIETWLLDTGDLSSMGDMDSIHRARYWLHQYAEILKPKYTRFLYGNHDAWPGKFPALMLPGELERHRRDLRSTVFKDQWPLAPLETDIPGRSSKLQLFSLNSVIHDRIRNTLARGFVRNDPHWESDEIAKNQLALLKHQAGKDPARNLRILAIHHPIHYPDAPKAVMTLKDATSVANNLISFLSEKIGALPHIVLSGHTHIEFPARGDFEKATHPPITPQKPLTNGQLQFIIGSLSQMASETQRVRVRNPEQYLPHQCQILTFWASPGYTDDVLIERRIVGRAAGFGDYDYIDCGDDDDDPKYVESLAFQY